MGAVAHIWVSMLHSFLLWFSLNFAQSTHVIVVCASLRLYHYRSNCTRFIGQTRTRRGTPIQHITPLKARSSCFASTHTPHTYRLNHIATERRPYCRHHVRLLIRFRVSSITVTMYKLLELAPEKEELESLPKEGNWHIAHYLASEIEGFFVEVLAGAFWTINSIIVVVVVEIGCDFVNFFRQCFCRHDPERRAVHFVNCTLFPVISIGYVYQKYASTIVVVPLSRAHVHPSRPHIRWFIFPLSVHTICFLS